MELKAKIIGVESMWEGVVIVIQQEKMRIPIAEEPETDESLIAKKFARGLKGIGFNIMQCEAPSGFRTGFWMPMEDYEAMGKPTIGDLVTMQLKTER